MIQINNSNNNLEIPFGSMDYRQGGESMMGGGSG